MATMRRKPVNKRSSARNFNKHAHKTHPFNIKIMRGGWRL